MNYTEAQTEFNIRLYRWAKAALHKEMTESFPSFQFCSERPSRTCMFLKSLDQHSRTVLGDALLLARHKNAAEVLRETISDETVTLLRQEEGFRLRTSPGTWEGRFADAIIPDKSALATRRQIKKAVKEHFWAAYGNQCLPPDPLDGTDDMLFGMKCRGWIINTSFEFGRWEPEVTYDQCVWTGKWVTKEEPAVLFANCIGFRLSYGNDIGIGSGWDKITIANIKPVCAEIMEHCQHMFAAFPSLLEGLELESLTA